MMKPKIASYVVNNQSQLWVLDDNVAIFNANHAKIVFAPNHHYDGLKVWAIKDGKALFVTDVASAIHFFEGNNES